MYIHLKRAYQPWSFIFKTPGCHEKVTLDHYHDRINSYCQVFLPTMGGFAYQLYLHAVRRQLVHALYGRLLIWLIVAISISCRTNLTVRSH